MNIYVKAILQASTVRCVVELSWMRATHHDGASLNDRFMVNRDNRSAQSLSTRFTQG